MKCGQLYFEVRKASSATLTIDIYIKSAFYPIRSYLAGYEMWFYIYMHAYSDYKSKKETVPKAKILSQPSEK